MIDGTAAGARKLEILKMLAYFALLFVGIRILHEIFTEMSTTPYFAELSRLSKLAASASDTAQSFDDAIVAALTLTMALMLVLPVAWVHMLTSGGKDDTSLAQ